MNRFVMPGAQWTDASSVIGNGYKLYFYSSGTSTPKNTYSDSTLITANANPVVAGTDGWGSIFLLTDEYYKVILKDANDATVRTWDPVGSVPLATDSPSDGVLASNYSTLAAADVAAATASKALVIPSAYTKTLTANYTFTAPIVDSRGGVITLGGYTLSHASSKVKTDPWLQCWGSGSGTLVFQSYPELTPRNFGAAGDVTFTERANELPDALATVSSSGTNDYAALQACITATPHVFFNGWFRTNTGLNAKFDGSNWRGFGPTKSGIYSTLTTGACVDLANSAYSAAPTYAPTSGYDVTEQFRMRNMGLRGPFTHATSFLSGLSGEAGTGTGRSKTLTSSSFSIGLKSKQNQFISLEDVYLGHFMRPFYGAAGDMQHMTRVYFTQGEILHYHQGSTDYDGAVNAFKFLVCRFDQCRFQEAWFGCKGDSAIMFQFEQCDFENINTPTYFSHGEDIQFNTCFFEYIYEGPYFDGGYTQKIRFDDCFFPGSGAINAGANSITLAALTGSSISGGGRLEIWPGTSVNGTVSIKNSSTSMNVIECGTGASYGTFTPTLKFGGGTTGITYNTNGQKGVYTLRGGKLRLNIWLDLTSKGSSTGSATITWGSFVPTIISSTPVANAMNYPVSVRAAATAAGVANVQAYIPTNTAQITLEKFAAGTATAMADTDFGNTTTLMIDAEIDVTTSVITVTN